MTEREGLTTSPPDVPSEFADVELPDLAEASILIVDDNLQNLELMNAYLEDLPCRLATATDGEEAVRFIEENRPDLILLDVMMPRMSGFEVCQKIKSSPGTRDIIVIMVTALHEVADLERAVECGTDEFLTKPVNKLELLTRVKSLLRVSLLQRKLNRLLELNRKTSIGESGGESGGEHGGERSGDADEPVDEATE